MPELPDIEAYLHALRPRAMGQVVRGVRLGNPFVLRSVKPQPSAVIGREVVALRRVGKRVCIGVQGGLWLVVHLMIAGRLHWTKPGAKLQKKCGLLAVDFDDGTLTLTEAGTKRRAGLWLAEGETGLAVHDPGGVDPMVASLQEFTTILRRENHTLKRTLTDPKALAGIGGAYSDEILHRARLSPLTWTTRLDDAELARLHRATAEVLREWHELLCGEAERAWPEKVTAFRPGMAVHGKYNAPCPVCQTAVQRIVHGDNETNYCPRCQTGGKILADRALSQLLHDAFPKTVDDL
jgi:formamidopyrimidine-DNA glycosylase